MISHVISDDNQVIIAYSSMITACTKPMCPNVGKIVRAFTAIVQRRHYQMVDLLLMGWW